MADEQNILTGKASIRAGSYQGGEFQFTPSQKAAMGSQPAAKPVSMDVLRDGSYAGEYHHVGGTVDVPPDQVETLTLSGFAARADRAEVAAAAREADAAEPAPSTAVAPMTTENTSEIAEENTAPRAKSARAAKTGRGKR